MLFQPMLEGAAALTLVAAWGQGADHGSACDRARAAAPILPLCVATPHAAVLTAEAAEGARLAALAGAGEDRFRQAFAADPAPYVIVQSDVPAAEHRAIRNAGFHVILPWFTRSGFQASMEAAVRRQVEAQSAGRSPEQIRAATDQALAQIHARMSNGAMDRDPQIVPHDLGSVLNRLAGFVEG